MAEAPIRGKYNMTPCHGGDRGFESPRGRQLLAPSPSITDFSYEKPILKLYQLKLVMLPSATPNFSYSRNPYPTKSYLTFGTILAPVLMVTSPMSLWRFHHEDRAGSPRISC